MTNATVEVHLSPSFFDEALRSDARQGLLAQPRRIPPKWFYDKRGSELFDAITETEEYYPTRRERSILASHAREIAERTKARTIIELGSGSSEKTRLILDAAQREGSLERFVPFDVCEEALRGALNVLAERFPNLDLAGVVGDFEEHLWALPQGDRRMIVLLGGTIGNFEPTSRAAFLASIRTVLAPGDWLLLGTDLVKDAAKIERAYNDASGITAEFNRNVLAVMNRELGADFDVDAFAHRAWFDAANSWIEMQLVSTTDQRVTIAALDTHIDIAADEAIRTEISAKFQPDGIAGELTQAGFRTEAFWTDDLDDFGLTLAQAI
ncbi:MAG: L-histidine N(alpha)-methyltransferase [Actinobacteria bacterium]|nr:L-histidine N(alpha)-methyltransferase [Actinomycetota bacterium]MCB9389632.1 L-histidine N(alpha)-methyltransferase [Acidimicrobiia bacterium]